MTLSYVLEGSGWATVTLAGENRWREISASYLADSLSDLTQAAIDLLKGADSMRIYFEDEPGEHRCVATRIGQDGLHFRVWYFEDAGLDLPDEKGLDVFSCDSTVGEFSSQVSACLQRLLDQHGLDGYKVCWVAHEFPFEKYQRLRELTH